MRTIPALRWWIVALIALGTVLNYIARNSLGVLAPELQRTMHISNAQYSYVVGAFQAAYTLMQPVCGWLVDRIGLRLGFALIALAWGLANMAHALAGGWLGLAVARGSLGVAEAGAIPSGIKAIAEWFPARERSKAVGWFNVGTSFGALLAPLLVGALALVWDWRAAFVATGAMSLGWAGLWFACYRAPAEHPALGPGERAMIEAGRGDEPAGEPIRPAALLGTARFWAIAVPRFLAEPAWQTFSFWIPLYLAQERGWDLKHIAAFAWLPFLFADLGGIAGGYLAPWLSARFGASLAGGRVGGVGLAALLMIAPGLVGFAASPYAAIALLCIGGLAHQVISVLINTLTADLWPRRDVGVANGLVGMAGWSGGLLFSLAVGQLSRSLGFAPLFGALGVFDLIGAAVLMLALRRGLLGGAR